jgi:hypothetical protein
MKYEVSITHKDIKDVKVTTNIIHTEVDEENINIHKFIEDVSSEAAHKALERHMNHYRVREGDSLKVDYIKEFKPVGD